MGSMVDSLLAMGIVVLSLLAMGIMVLSLLAMGIMVLSLLLTMGNMVLCVMPSWLHLHLPTPSFVNDAVPPALPFLTRAP